MPEKEVDIFEVDYVLLFTFSNMKARTKSKLDALRLIIFYPILISIL